VQRSGKPDQVADVRLASGYLARSPLAVATVELAGARTLLTVPLLKEGKVIGGIALYRTEVRPFDAKQIELLASFADQAVIAIENARLFEAEQARTKELAASLDDLRAAQDRLVQTENLLPSASSPPASRMRIKNPLNFVNNFSALSAELTDELNDVLKPAALSEKIRGEVDELTKTLKDNLEKVVQHGKRADSIVKTCCCIDISRPRSPVPSRECSSMFLTMESARLPCWTTFSRLSLSVLVSSSTSHDFFAKRRGLQYIIQLIVSSADSAEKIVDELSGFLISCAMPAVSWPREASFSVCTSGPARRADRRARRRALWCAPVRPRTAAHSRWR